MSARVLTFGPHMIHLQCHEKIVRENGGEAPSEYFKFKFQDLDRWP